MQVDAILRYFEELREQHHEVSNKSRALTDSCERLVQSHQQPLSMTTKAQLHVEHTANQSRHMCRLCWGLSLSLRDKNAYKGMLSKQLC